MAELLTNSYHKKIIPGSRGEYAFTAAPGLLTEKNRGLRHYNRYKQYTESINNAIPLFLHSNIFKSAPEIILPLNENQARGCTAVKLSTILITAFVDGRVLLHEDGLIDEEICCQFIEAVENNGVINNFDDIETLLLTIQQLFIIIRESGILKDTKGTPGQPAAGYYSRLYINLFSAFWKRVQWQNIFPSMPGTASALQKNQKSIAEILSQREGIFRLDDSANELIKALNLGEENDLLLISFLDFYLFTWLCHFGIISYLKGPDHAPVKIKLTEHGKKFLRVLEKY